MAGRTAAAQGGPTPVVHKKKRGGKKSEKDPNAPKRALSAYMFFANANRDDVKEKNPQFTFGEVGKELGRLWNSLGDKGKAQYEAMAVQDKVRYEEEKRAYQPNQQYA